MNGSAPSRSVPASKGPATSVLAEGTVFAGRYRVVSTIAVGGMGAVYEVIHTETERRRALKVMHPHLFQSEEMRERFKREARIAAQIESEYIVDVSDAGVDEATRTPFIVMELLQGEDLGQRMKRVGRLPPGEVITYLQQVGLALDKTHARSIVHRDLKPDNVFLCTREDGSHRVKILDFGVAKLIAEEATSAGATRSLGTPLYMAPEQFRLGSQLQPAADIYALGMMAYTLLVGQPYWAGEAKISGDVIAFAMAVVLGPQESAVRRAAQTGVTLPPGFDPWFSKTTAPVPTDRYPSASEAVRALASALGLSPAAPRPAAPAAAVPAPAAAAPTPAAQITGSAQSSLSTVLMGSSPLATAADARVSRPPAQPPPAQPPQSAHPSPQGASQGLPPDGMPPRVRTVPLPPPPASATAAGPQRGSWLPEQPASPPPAPQRFQPPAASAAVTATGPQRGSWLPEQPASPPSAPPAFHLAAAATGPQQASWLPPPPGTSTGAAVAVAAPIAAPPREGGRGPLIAALALIGAVLLAGTAWALLGKGGSATVAPPAPAETSPSPTSSVPAATAPPAEPATSSAPSSSAPPPEAPASPPSASSSAAPTAAPQASGARPSATSSASNSTSTSTKPKPPSAPPVKPSTKPLLGRD